MTMIDPTARVADGAVIAKDVFVGPFCVIGPDVSIAEGCRLTAHVHVTGHTSIGPRTKIAPFASLGTPPQSARYRGGPTRLVIGADCDIREHVTMNTGTEDDRGVTEVGDKCFLMVNTHVGHDCKVGNNVIMANNAVLGGHVVVEDFVFIGGNSAIHQFVRIGESVMISGVAGVAADIIPFGFAIGQRAVLDGLDEFREHLGGHLTLLMLRGIGNPFEIHEVRAGDMIRSIDVLRGLEEARLTGAPGPAASPGRATP